MYLTYILGKRKKRQTSRVSNTLIGRTVWKSIVFGPESQEKMWHSLRNSQYTFCSLPPNTSICSKTVSMHFCEIYPPGFWPIGFETTQVNWILTKQHGCIWWHVLEKYIVSLVIAMLLQIPSPCMHGTSQMLGQNIKEALLLVLFYQGLNHHNKSCL